MSEDKKLVDYKIKKRNDTYFLVTESDLNEIKSKSNYADLAFLFTSIFFGGLISIIITLSYGIDLSSNAKNILQTLLWVFIALSVGCLIIALILNQERKKIITKIKGKEDISVQVDDYQEQPNLEKYKGNHRIGVNISVAKKDTFFEKVKENQTLSAFKSSNHPNSLKAAYFTFIMDGVSDELIKYFESFLQENKIEFIDLKYI